MKLNFGWTVLRRYFCDHFYRVPVPFGISPGSLWMVAGVCEKCGYEALCRVRILHADEETWHAGTIHNVSE